MASTSRTTSVKSQIPSYVLSNPEGHPIVHIGGRAYQNPASASQGGSSNIVDIQEVNGQLVTTRNVGLAPTKEEEKAGMSLARQSDFERYNQMTYASPTDLARARQYGQTLSPNISTPTGAATAYQNPSGQYTLSQPGQPVYQTFNYPQRQSPNPFGEPADFTQEGLLRNTRLQKARQSEQNVEYLKSHEKQATKSIGIFALPINFLSATARQGATVSGAYYGSESLKKEVPHSLGEFGLNVLLLGKGEYILEQAGLTAKTYFPPLAEAYEFAKPVIQKGLGKFDVFVEKNNIPRFKIFNLGFPKTAVSPDVFNYKAGFSEILPEQFIPTQGTSIKEVVGAVEVRTYFGIPGTRFKVPLGQPTEAFIQGLPEEGQGIKVEQLNENIALSQEKLSFYATDMKGRLYTGEIESKAVIAGNAEKSTYFSTARSTGSYGNYEGKTLSQSATVGKNVKLFETEQLTAYGGTAQSINFNEFGRTVSMEKDLTAGIQLKTINPDIGNFYSFKKPSSTTKSGNQLFKIPGGEGVQQVGLSPASVKEIEKQFLPDIRGTVEKTADVVKTIGVSKSLVNIHDNAYNVYNNVIGTKLQPKSKSKESILINKESNNYITPSGIKLNQKNNTQTYFSSYTTPIISTKSQQKPLLSYGTSNILKEKQITTQLTGTQLITKQKSAFGNPFAPFTGPGLGSYKFPLIPLLPTFSSIGEGYLQRGGAGKQQNRYQASLVGLLSGKRGKQPKGLTGLEVRYPVGVSERLPGTRRKTRPLYLLSKGKAHPIIKGIAKQLLLKTRRKG